MVQKQVVDYARDQLKLGVARDVIKSALFDAGWAIADIDDSLKSLDSAELHKIEEKKPQASSPLQTIVISDLIAADSKLQPMPAGKADFSAKKGSSKIETLQSLGFKNYGPSKSGTTILIVLLAIVALGAAGLAAYLYLQNKGLQDKAVGFSSKLEATNSRVAGLTSQLDNLTKQKNDSDLEIAELASENKKTLSKLSLLSFFIVPAGASSSESMEFVLKGTLAGGGKLLYTVTSNEGIKVSIKNSADAKVEAALKDLVGKEVEIGGTHVPKSFSVDVASVNGAAIQ